tara:strand:- start:211 stop:426 length:216 start_codon:yes stop_codon:yes gene_type:complete
MMPKVADPLLLLTVNNYTDHETKGVIVPVALMQALEPAVTERVFSDTKNKTNGIFFVCYQITDFHLLTPML